MNIRNANIEDLEIFLNLNAEVQSLHAKAWPEIFKPTSEVSLTDEDFKRMLSNPLINIYIAESGNSSLGYCYTQIIERPENPYKFASKKLYINHLAVRSHERGKGIGSALIKHAISKAKESDITVVELDSWTFNQKAIDFFLSFGFKIYNVNMTLSD